MHLKKNDISYKFAFCYTSFCNYDYTFTVNLVRKLDRLTTKQYFFHFKNTDYLTGLDKEDKKLVTHSTRCFHEL